MNDSHECWDKWQLQPIPSWKTSLAELVLAVVCGMFLTSDANNRPWHGKPAAPVLLGIEAVGDAGGLVVGQHGARLAVHERRLLLLRAELEAPVRHDDAARQRPLAGVLRGQGSQLKPGSLEREERERERDTVNFRQRMNRDRLLKRLQSHTSVPPAAGKAISMATRKAAEAA